MEENYNSGQPVYQEAYGPTGPVAIMNGQSLFLTRLALPGGGIVAYAQGTSGPTISRWYHPDWQGSIRLNSDSSHNVYNDEAYAPFGEQYADTGTSTIFTGQWPMFQWEYYDFPYREYQSIQGRWLSPDPAGLAATNPANPQSWNRYAYVTNNPLALVDPTGKLSSVIIPYFPSDPLGGGGGGSGSGSGGPCITRAIGPGAHIFVGNCGQSPTAGGGGGGGAPAANIGSQSKTSVACLVQRAASLAKAGINAGVAAGKISTAAAAGLSSVLDGPVGAATAGYLAIGATGNLIAAGAQLVGAFNGNLSGTGEVATLATTVTTGAGLATLAYTGNLETASTAASFESVGTAGLNGGMTGSLIDESASAVTNLLTLTDTAESIADLLGLNSTGACR